MTTCQRASVRTHSLANAILVPDGTLHLSQLGALSRCYAGLAFLSFGASHKHGIGLTYKVSLPCNLSSSYAFREIDWKSWKKHSFVYSLFDLDAGESTNQTDVDTDKLASPANLAGNLSGVDTSQKIREIILESLAIDDVSDKTPLVESGVDSLNAHEIRQNLESLSGTALPYQSLSKPTSIKTVQKLVPL